MCLVCKVLCVFRLNIGHLDLSSLSDTGIIDLFQVINDRLTSQISKDIVLSLRLISPLNP